MGEYEIVWKLQKLAYAVIRIVGAGIFTFLTVASMTRSQYMFPQTREISIDCYEKPFFHIISVCSIVVILLLMMKFGEKMTLYKKVWIERIALVVSALWMACGGMGWISSLDRIPAGDQAFIYGGASYFLEGQFSFLAPGGYCSMYPHQMGIIALLELLFLGVGTFNYFAVEVINVWLAVGIVFLGYGLMKELAMSFSARLFYCLLIMGCVPLIFYTSWVYGDISSIFFAMLIAWFVLRWHNCPRRCYLVGIVAAAVMAMLVRKNSMIFLIALCILAVVYVARYRRWQMAATVLLAVVCPFIIYQGIYEMYEIRSGYKHCDGFSANSWIMMGVLEQEEQMCGWYNNLQKEILYSVDYDYEEAEQIVSEVIKERFQVFRTDQEYAVWFYKKKIMSQWLDPLYQSIYFSGQNLEKNPPVPGGFLDGLYNKPEVHDQIFRFSNIIQSLVYFGMLLYFLFAVRKDKQPFEYLLAVTVIGGFLFSILWEAKARYIFPYYVMMYPLAVTGYFSFIEQMHAFREKMIKNRINIGKKSGQ